MINLRSALAVNLTAAATASQSNVFNRKVLIVSSRHGKITRSRQAGTRAEGGRMLTRCPSCSGP